MSHVCLKCQRQFSSVSSLNRHVRNVHEKDQGEKIFECHDCVKSYRSRKSLAIHWRRSHRIQRHDKNTTTRRCPLCKSDFPSKEIITHFVNEHDLEIEEENYVFPDENSFQKWKIETEGITSSKFTLRYCQNEKTMKMYGCHRSGLFKSKSKGIRHLKTQGSRKIDAFCPAALRVVKSMDCVQVKYTKTHVGHANELCHLEISPTQKDEIAFKLMQNVPKRAILRGIRSSYTGEIKREHLVKMKDIDNVALKYNIGHEYKLHSNDADSIDKSNDNLKIEDCSFVQFYKPQGTTYESVPFLNTDDFVLILMNSAQADLLKKFGENIICVDGTHGIGYNLTLFSIIIMDEYHAGFPCSIMISNRKDAKVLEFFFQTVKNVVGCIISKTFMSDMASELYAAWETVMGSVENRLFCSWHVQKSWKENLNKIKNRDKRKPVFQFLKTLADELDEDKFTILLEDLMKLFEEDPDLQNYGVYFTQHYFYNAKYWAACYRKKSQINTNMSLERMHKTLKYCYFDGEKINRLDKSIYCLLTSLQDKLFDRLTALHMGTISKKIKLLRSKHKLHNTVEVQRESEDVFLVTSSSGKDVYRVVKNYVNCECKIVCEDCKTCIHVYCCTCRDNTIAFNMCKHIHSVCIYQMTDLNILANRTNISQEMTFSNNHDEIIIIDCQDDEIIDSDIQGTYVENDFCINTTKESIIEELGDQKLPKIKKKDVGILYRTILKSLKTKEEVFSFYKNLEQFQKILVIDQRCERRASMSKVCE